MSLEFAAVTPGAKSSGVWDSIHVFEATDRARMSHYKLTSTIMLHLATENSNLGEMDLSGNLTRQVEVDLPVESDASHIPNIGKLVEDMELKMRNQLRMLLLCYLLYSVHSEYWLTVYRGGLFWKSQRYSGRAPKYIPFPSSLSATRH